MASQRRAPPPSPKGDKKKNEHRNLVPPRVYSCDESEIRKNPSGVRTCPAPGKRKGRGGSPGGKASPVHRHKDTRPSRRPAVARQELDISWFSEGNCERSVSYGTRAVIEHDLDAFLRADSATRVSILSGVGVAERAYLVSAKGRGSCVDLLRARAKDTLATIPVVREAKVKEVVVQLKKQDKPVQAPRPAERSPVPAYFVPRRDRGAVAKVLEQVLGAAGLSSAAKARARDLLREEYGILVTL